MQIGSRPTLSFFNLSVCDILLSFTSKFSFWIEWGKKERKNKRNKWCFSVIKICNKSFAVNVSEHCDEIRQNVINFLINVNIVLLSCFLFVAGGNLSKEVWMGGSIIRYIISNATHWRRLFALDTSSNNWFWWRCLGMSGDCQWLYNTRCAHQSTRTISCAR